MNLPATYDIGEKLKSQCEDFAKLMSLNNQAHEFNEISTKPRDQDSIYKDNLIGKIAEVGVYLWLATRGIYATTPDFTVIGKNKRDDGDITNKGKHISVKSTERGRCLLVHTGQLAWHRADVYFVCNSKPDSSKIKIRGYAFDDDLVSKDGQDVGKLSIFILKGECIPNTNAKLQADNFCIKDLQTDFDTLIRRLT